jgi:uncharacterized protein (UPF0261 family)
VTGEEPRALQAAPRAVRYRGNHSVRRCIYAAAVDAMARGAAVIIRTLCDDGRLDGIIGLGDTGGSTIATTAMRGLPVGVPKLMVSTVASGDTRPYVGAVDVTMMYPSSTSLA